MTVDAETMSRETFRNLPSIDLLLRHDAVQAILPLAGAAFMTGLAQSAVDSLRDDIGSGQLTTGTSAKELIAEAASRVSTAWEISRAASTRRVINATGVIVHTNLGRAPLSDAAREAIADAAGYCTVEYDLSTGSRGKRGAYAESLIAEITGAESSIIVNNCAAAAFLVMSVFAEGGEVVVSRGELVEIGGDFRVPDVLKRSGARLCEVGTTNRTRIFDYEDAISPETAMVLRVHPSNYRIVGFTAKPSVAELAEVAHDSGIIFYEDAGSGDLIDTRPFGLDDEPQIAASLAAGADLVSFSGDKLLGGPQCGIIAGRRSLIDEIRSNPLYRALRVGKLVYAALEATLESYRRGTAAEDIPVLRMLSMTEAETAKRCTGFMERFGGRFAIGDGLTIETIDGMSAVGGGAAPGVEVKTHLIALTHQTMSASAIEQKLRSSELPVIARIVDGRVLIDLRTVAENEEQDLAAALAAIA